MSTVDEIIEKVKSKPKELPGLGRKFYRDARDFRFPAIPKQLAQPGARSRMWYDRGVWDQGTTPQCVAFSALKWLEAGPVRNVDLDIYKANLTLGGTLQRFYEDCQQNDEWPGEGYDGTSVRAAFKVLQRAGMIGTYYWAYDVATVVNWILTTGPVVLGTDWTPQMFYPKEVRHSVYFIETGSIYDSIGGHAYLAIGVDLDLKTPSGTNGAIRIVNSWGEEWGEKGRAWISLADVQGLITNYGEACCAQEIKV